MCRGTQRIVIEAEIIRDDARHLQLFGERALARLPRTNDRRRAAHAENVAQLVLDASTDQRHASPTRTVDSADDIGVAYLTDPE
jgi:hypothetical protein